MGIEPIGVCPNSLHRRRLRLPRHLGLHRLRLFREEATDRPQDGGGLLHFRLCPPGAGGVFLEVPQKVGLGFTELRLRRLHRLLRLHLRNYHQRRLLRRLILHRPPFRSIGPVFPDESAYQAGLEELLPLRLIPGRPRLHRRRFEYCSHLLRHRTAKKIRFHN